MFKIGLFLRQFCERGFYTNGLLLGGLTKARDLILKPTRKAMEENLFQVFKDKVKIFYSDLKEADVAILGAISLV